MIERYSHCLKSNVPANLQDPRPFKYRAMIHRLSEAYGISPRDAECLTEFDYYTLVVNVNLEALRIE